MFGHCVQSVLDFKAAGGYVVFVRFFVWGHQVTLSMIWVLFKCRNTQKSVHTPFWWCSTHGHSFARLWDYGIMTWQDLHISQLLLYQKTSGVKILKCGTKVQKLKYIWMLEERRLSVSSAFPTHDCFVPSLSDVRARYCDLLFQWALTQWFSMAWRM